MSIQQASLKRRASATELSLETSATTEPRRSTVLKTVLKSPARTVGTVGSILLEMSSKNVSRSGLRLGAYTQAMRKVISRKEKLHKRKRPESSDCDETKEKHGRNRMMQPQDLWVPGEETYE